MYKRLWLLCLIGLFGLCMSAFGQALNQIGRQSQNEGMLAVPAPGKVTIDGDLQDWDWSGRIRVFADTAVRDRYSVEAAAMWDKDNLYLGAKWKAPLPMFSMVDPNFEPESGWKADSWQMRIATADQRLWLTTWYFTPRKQPVMHIAYWKQIDRYTGTVPPVLLMAPPGGTVLGKGAEMAYKMDADGQGFSQEIKIPWALLFKNVPEIKDGTTLRMGNEFLWADPSGKTFPIHRYADNMQPGKTSREFYWTAVDCWGDVKLVGQNNVPVREYRSDTGRIQGTVPVRARIPANAARFTLVIEDQHGARIRTLAADREPADYRVKAKDKAGLLTVEVPWDCQDDHGKLVAPGTYTVRGLTQKGLTATYEMTFYDPGTPPWATRDGRGGWGADHSCAFGTATGGDDTLLSFPIVEGGWGIIALDATGKKRLSIHPNTSYLAADAEYVYADVGAIVKDEVLNRFVRKDGAEAPFMQDGKPRPFHLSLSDILGAETTAQIAGMAVSGGQLVLALTNNKLLVLDAKTAAVLKQFDAPTPTAPAFSRDGKLYALLDGKLNRIDLTTGAGTPIPTPGLGQASALAVDADGNLLLADIGADSQVKAFSPQGTLVYTCGKKGGRPMRGAFDPQTMTHMSGVSVDMAGQVWVTENWEYPRRVSVWGHDGKLIRDYIGNGSYAGGGSTLHHQDPTLGYVGPVELKLNKADGSWKVSNVLWVPDIAKGESFNIPRDSEVARFTSSASGKPHEYMYVHCCGNVVFMERNGNWQPVAAVCLAGNVSGRLLHNGSVAEAPSGEMAGLNAYDSIIWNDHNGDGKVQRDECVIIPAKRPGTAERAGESALQMHNGWMPQIGEDLTIYTDGISAWKPASFTADGAPIYTQAACQPVGVVDWGDLLPIPAENRLICMSAIGYAGPTKLIGIDLKSGKTEWYYPNPYPGVHGSHNATMPKPGLLIGPINFMGAVRVNDEIGTVFAMRGNLGQDFFFTTDGLYVGALFQDCRLPGEAPPESEAQLKTMPLEGMSEGGEPFNGWFGKQADGVTRMTTGMIARDACSILQIHGLEGVHRFTGGTVTLDAVQIAKADADTTAHKTTATPKHYVVTRAAKAPVLDGNPGAWAKIPSVPLVREGLPDHGTAQLAYDDQNLYVQFEIFDNTPWLNEGKDFQRLFKTGDAVDLQLGLDTKVHLDPVAGDQRLLIAQFNGQPVVVRMVPVDATAPAVLKTRYTSPVGTKIFARVEVMTDARVKVKVENGRYRVQAAIPLATLGIAPKSGLALRGDMGFISSDTQGLINTARTYWANPATNLVNDLPLEAWPTPAGWGELTLE